MPMDTFIWSVRWRLQPAMLYLQYLLHKGVCWLQVHLLAVLLDGWNEDRVVWLRQLHTREQV